MATLLASSSLHFANSTLHCSSSFANLNRSFSLWSSGVGEAGVEIVSEGIAVLHSLMRSKRSLRFPFVGKLLSLQKVLSCVKLMDSTPEGIGLCGRCATGLPGGDFNEVFISCNRISCCRCWLWRREFSNFILLFLLSLSQNQKISIFARWPGLFVVSS